MSIEKVIKGEPPRAADQNQLIGFVNHLSRPAGGMAQSGSGGIGVPGEPPVPLAIFELTADPVYTDPSGQPSDHYEAEPTATATAKQVWCHRHNGTADTYASYGGIGNSREETIYFPLARRDANGYAVGPPHGKSGDRFWCQWNSAAARWEVLQPFVTVCWGKLDGALSQGSSATVSLWWGGSTPYDSGINVTAYDWLLKSGQQLDAGTKVKVEWFPQDGVWWVTAAEC